MGAPEDSPADGFWLVPDLHLGHAKVSALCGFPDVAAHDRAILDNVREVPDGATVICLGDISVRDDVGAPGTLAQLKVEKGFTMVLVPGNHDRVHPKVGIASVVGWTPAYRQVFDGISLELRVKVSLVASELMPVSSAVIRPVAGAGDPGGEVEALRLSLNDIDVI